MKKYLVSALFLISFAAYAFWYKKPTAILGSLTPTPVGSGEGTYVDGIYTGQVFDAYYGNMQVGATVSGGKITDVQFLKYPNDRPTSVQINTEALALLRQEVIQKQSAQVDIISGATDSSKAFVKSLGSALAQAK